MSTKKIDLRHDMRATAVKYFDKVAELEKLSAEVEELKHKVIAIIADNGKDVDGTASGKTDRMEATIQYKGEPNHLQFSVTTSKGRVDNTAALKEANRRIVALGGEEVNPDDFRGTSTISQKLVWVELEDAKKAAKKKK